MKILSDNYFDVYNFLNIIDRRLGKLFKLTHYSPLPDGFVIDDEKLEDVLILDQMKNDEVMPPFLYENKKTIKKHFKTSQKHIDYLIRHHVYEKFVSKDFAAKISIYFNLRKDMNDFLLKELSKQEVDEVACYREAYNINPILGEMLDCLYDGKINFEEVFKNIEQNYQISYNEKLKLLTKKQNKKKEKDAQIEEQIKHAKSANKQKTVQKERKMSEKTIKNTQKLEKTAEIKKVRAENQKSKKNNIKEK